MPPLLAGGVGNLANCPSDRRAGLALARGSMGSLHVFQILAHEVAAEVAIDGGVAEAEFGGVGRLAADHQHQHGDFE